MSGCPRASARVRLAAIGCVAAIFALAPAAVAADRGANGVVVFQQGSTVIVSLQGNGTETVLTPSGQSQSSPSVSPDGGRIAFVMSYHLWVEKIDGTAAKAVPVTGNPYEAGPTWSPTATKIAYINGTDGQLYDVSVNGGTPVRLTTGGQHLADPKWSPDGKKIAFDAFDSKSSHTQVFTVGTSGTHKVTRLTATGTCLSSQPDWSPDGTRIALSTSCFEGAQNIAVMAASGGPLTAVANYFAAGAGYPTWSPDGSEIVFSASEGTGSEQLWESPPSVAGNVNDVSATRLTNDPGQPLNTAPSWQPVHSPALVLSAASGVRGSTVVITGSDFLAGQTLHITFVDANKVKTVVASPKTAFDGTFSTTVTVPAGAALGKATISVNAAGLKASGKYTVTG